MLACAPAPKRSLDNLEISLYSESPISYTTPYKRLDQQSTPATNIKVPIPNPYNLHSITGRRCPPQAKGNSRIAAVFIVSEEFKVEDGVLSIKSFDLLCKLCVFTDLPCAEPWRR